MNKNKVPVEGRPLVVYYDLFKNYSFVCSNIFTKV